MSSNERQCHSHIVDVRASTTVRQFFPFDELVHLSVCGARLHMTFNLFAIVDGIVDYTIINRPLEKHQLRNRRLELTRG